MKYILHRRINACGDSRLRGQGSRKPIGFRQWVVHSALKKIPSANVVKARCVEQKEKNMLTTGELENICKYINKEFGSDCPICIQIRNENGSLKEADYVVDFCNDKSGVLYLMNHKFKNGSCE